jgi:murein DD-endopeptidase MepM/ murein hydrolase activator NlpD
MMTIPSALAIFALILGLGTSPAVGATTPKFLTLPFQSPQHIHIQRGWWTPQFLGGPFTLLHHGIDYINGTLDVTSTWQNFPVVAAAAGEACAEVLGGTGCYDHSGEVMGNRVLIKHTVGGVVYYTFYNHLKSISSFIPIGSRNRTVHVKQGQVIGIAGASGNDPTFIHLHFELQNASGKWLDPYGLYTSSRQYPDPKGRNGILSGPKNYFLTNPPTVLGAAASPTPSPRPSATPKASHRPPPTPFSSGPVATALPSGTSGPTPAQTQTPAATASAAAVVVPGTGGIPPPGGAASTGDLALTTIVAGILAVACFTFLAVVLLRRRLTGVGSGP